MRRVMTGGIATWLAAASLLVLVPAASADTGVAGMWTSIDSDGSTQALSVGRGSTPAVTYVDFYASSCDAAGSPSTVFVATGRGALGDDSMWVDFRNGGCGRHKLGPFGLGFDYDSGGDTLTDSFGITWYRAP
jgi:hypothetical protein